MSHSYAKSVDGCVINVQAAAALAERNAERENSARRVARLARGLFTVALPITVTVASAGVGLMLGEDLARTALGRAVLGIASPIIATLSGLGPAEILIGFAVIAMTGLVIYVRS
jgi:hypothetical protein